MPLDLAGGGGGVRGGGKLPALDSSVSVCTLFGFRHLVVHLAWPNPGSTELIKISKQTKVVWNLPEDFVLCLRVKAGTGGFTLT